jgi:hypothetical protein
MRDHAPRDDPYGVNAVQQSPLPIGSIVSCFDRHRSLLRSS